MTTHELAKILLEKPDVMAIVSGYEGGFNEILKVNEPEAIILNVNSECYMGQHEFKSSAFFFEDENNKQETMAVLIMGGKR